jgi:hypothetical protein
MPTLLLIRGWRFFCYTNERNEPPHVHIRKGNSECKFWLLPEKFDVEEVYAYGMNPADMRLVRQIVFENFDYLVSEYIAIQKGERDE